MSPAGGTGRTRPGRQVILVVGAVVVLCTALVAGFAAGILPGTGGSDPKPNPAVDDPWPVEAYTPGEITRRVTIQRSGDLRVRELIVFDAGPRGDLPVTRYVGRVRAGKDSSGMRFVDPTWPTRPHAVEVGADGTTRPLRLSSDPLDSTYDPTGREWRIRPAHGPWTRGRHAIRLSYQVSGVHTGSSTVVVPPEADVDLRTHVAVSRLVITGPRGDRALRATCYHPTGDRDGNARPCGSLGDDGRSLRLDFTGDDYQLGSVEVEVDGAPLTGRATPLDSRSVS